MNIESKYPQTFSLGTVWTFAKVLNVDIREMFKPIPNEAEAEDNHKQL